VRNGCGQHFSGLTDHHVLSPAGWITDNVIQPMLEHLQNLKIKDKFLTDLKV